MPSHWIWDLSSSLEVWGVEAFFVRTNPPPDFRHKMKKQCSKYSLKMENTKIFQKDGKDEYIPNGWKMCIHSKRMKKMKIFQNNGEKNIPKGWKSWIEGGRKYIFQKISKLKNSWGLFHGRGSQWCYDRTYPRDSPVLPRTPFNWKQFDFDAYFIHNTITWRDNLYST